MRTWLPIQYRGFWDVPRIFLVRQDGRTYLFDCSFNEGLDEYPDDYTVYLIPNLADDQLPKDWTLLKDNALCRLGNVPVSRVQFDESRRHQVNIAVFEELMPSIGSAKAEN